MIVTRTALKFRTSVNVLIVLIVLMGVDAYRKLPLEAAPDISIPIILVSTVYPGVAPEDMESLVTNVIERQLKELRDVKDLKSSSAESVSVINIEFESEVDMDDAYQKVRDKVDQALPDLPADAEDPVLTEVNFSEFPIMLVNLFGKVDLVRLKKIGEGLEERIEQIDGVLNVDVMGGLEREIQVFLNPERMKHYDLGVGTVINRIREEHLNMPGGNLELGGSKYLVRVPGEYKKVSEMEDIVLKAPQGNPVKLRDVGRVVDGFKDRDSISRVDGAECVTLRIQKRSGENIVRIADEVRAMMAEVEAELPSGVNYIVRQDHSEYVRDTVKDLENSVISGLLLVLLVLFFFMRLRNAFFVAIAIPISLLITVSILHAVGFTLNMVVLFSLLLAVGMLVDNSIVVIENIFRYVSEGMDRKKAAYEATREVAWPIIASTATTVGVFTPMLFWPGIMGEFMSYLPATVIVALLASLFVALVINPVLASIFLKRIKKQIVDESGEATNRIMRGYQKVLTWSIRHPYLLLGISNLSLVVVVGLYGVFGAGIEFFPETTPERVQISVDAPEGTAIENTDRMVRTVEGLAKSDDNTENVVSNVGIGGGEVILPGAGGNTHKAILDLEFLDRHQRTHSTWDSVKSLREKLGKLSGAEYRLKLEEGGPPVGEAVAVEVSGPDYAVLQDYSRRIKDILETVPGVVDLKDDYEPGKPEIRVEVDREKAMVRKLNTSGIAYAIRTAVQGTEASVLREGDEEFDIIVRYDQEYRSSINDLLDLTVTGKDDLQVPLRDVAQVRTTGGLGSIKHIDQKRTILVSSDVMGERSSSEVLIDVKNRLEKEIEMPPGYYLSFGGESEEQDKASAFLSRAFSIGILLMAMILISQFNSVLQPLIILGSVVMSMIGVLLGLMAIGEKFGIIMTGMGVISLAGVVVNNAIVMIDFINQLRRKHGMKLEDALVRAGILRFRPVLMTAITTILGMLPMAIGVSIDFTTFTIDVGAESLEWWGPMARAIIFGLAFATLMTLVMVPVMYYLLVRIAWRFRRLFRMEREEAVG